VRCSHLHGVAPKNGHAASRSKYGRGIRSRTSPLATAEFATIRERLMKIGARIIEHTARIRIHLPSSCPERALFRTIALSLMPCGGAMWPNARPSGQINPKRVAQRVPSHRSSQSGAAACPFNTRVKARYVVHDCG
jgi:Transposase DDE domain group 1